VIYRDAHVTAFISPRAWPRNRGHVIVIPNAHVESLYEIEPATHHRVVDLAQRVALALKRGYGCDGVSTRQHNEPAGNQDVWHFHLHVFPRYQGDDLYATGPEPGWLDPGERAQYAERLRPWLAGT
jgi:histidine triad (HIT) family protein